MSYFFLRSSHLFDINVRQFKMKILDGVCETICDST
jgi:hypothetical protein